MNKFDLDKINKECLVTGYFLHSSGLVDDLWIDLKEFNKCMTEEMDNIISCIFDKYEKIRNDAGFDTIFYFDNPSFNIDVHLNISYHVKREIKKRYDAYEIMGICHSMIYRNPHINDKKILINLEDPYYYKGVIFFPTTFHSSFIRNVIKYMQDERKVEINGVIFLVERQSDEIKNKIGSIKYDYLFKIVKNRIH